MGTRAVEQGPVGQAVARNLRAVRERRQLSQQQLSAALADVGRPILATGIAKIEAGDRRVDVDDLMALALSLNVTPLRLLLPSEESPDGVPVTARRSASVIAAWAWLAGDQPLPEEDGRPPSSDATLAYLDERPPWLRKLREHPLALAVRFLEHSTFMAIRGFGHPDTKLIERQFKRANAAVEEVAARIDELEAEFKVSRKGGAPRGER